jgi:hypothetical protein
MVFRGSQCVVNILFFYISPYKHTYIHTFIHRYMHAYMHVYIHALILQTFPLIGENKYTIMSTLLTKMLSVLYICRYLHT